MWAVEKAQALYKTRMSSGFACATCHNEPEKNFKSWAATMPKWEPRLDKVLGVEEFITRHASATSGAKWPMETEDNHVMSVYLHYLANGSPVDVDTANGPAKAAYARGEALAERKRGQYDHFPTWRTSLQTIWDIRQRFQWCQVNIRADELPPDAKEYGDLELYLAAKNSGLKLSVPGIRH
jgi:sulfur-oxidizing protein SoxA